MSDECREIPVIALNAITEVADAGTAGANSEIVGTVRRVAYEVTGGNCAFVEDDIRVLGALAKWAILNGVPDEICPSIIYKARKHLAGESLAFTGKKGAEICRNHPLRRVMERAAAEKKRDAKQERIQRLERRIRNQRAQLRIDWQIVESRLQYKRAWLQSELLRQILKRGAESANEPDVSKKKIAKKHNTINAIKQEKTGQDDGAEPTTQAVSNCYALSENTRQTDTLHGAINTALDYLDSDRFPHKSANGNDRLPVVKRLRTALEITQSVEDYTKREICGNNEKNPANEPG